MTACVCCFSLTLPTLYFRVVWRLERRHIVIGATDTDSLIPTTHFRSTRYNLPQAALACQRCARLYVVRPHCSVACVSWIKRNKETSGARLTQPSGELATGSAGNHRNGIYFISTSQNTWSMFYKTRRPAIRESKTQPVSRNGNL